VQDAIRLAIFMLKQSEPILRGLGDEHRALEPMPGTKTAGWLVGHLTFTGDFARRMCGRTPICNESWTRKFAPGTQPSTDAATYPPMAELISTFGGVYSDLIAAASEAPRHVLTSPNPYSVARERFPTVRDFLFHLMTAHFAYHLGQLQCWRAAAGVGVSPGSDRQIA
jgi:DinB superfamily